MLQGTWKSTNFVPVFENEMGKKSIVSPGDLLKTGLAKRVLKVNLSDTRAVLQIQVASLFKWILNGLNEFRLSGSSGCICANGYIIKRAVPHEKWWQKKTLYRIY